MIQLDNLVEFVESVAPPKLYHYNRFISATVSAGLADGKQSDKDWKRWIKLPPKP